MFMLIWEICTAALLLISVLGYETEYISYDVGVVMFVTGLLMWAFQTGREGK